MKYNNLGSLSCSYLGLGYMRYHNKTQKEINEMVNFAIRKGINYFESCYFYLDNQCEHIVAESLKKYNREDFFYCFCPHPFDVRIVFIIPKIHLYKS